MTAITDKTSLLARASSYLDNPAWWTDEAEGFLGLVNGKFKRYFAQTPIRTQETETTLTGTTDSRTLTLPADFDAPISLHLTTFGEKTRLLAQVAGFGFDQGTTSGTPSRWAIDGTTIVLDLPCDQAHTFTFRYVSNFALTDASPTNWLLTNHPDAYLNAVLSQAYAFSRNRQAAMDYMALTDGALNEITDAAHRSKAVAVSVVDNALASTGGFNIITGY